VTAAINPVWSSPLTPNGDSVIALKSSSLVRAAMRTTSEAQCLFFLAAAGHASAAELDALLLDIHAEHRIRRAAQELAETAIAAENIHLIDDLLKAALHLAAGVV